MRQGTVERLFRWLCFLWRQAKEVERNPDRVTPMDRLAADKLARINRGGTPYS